MFLSTDSGLITLNTSNLINIYACKDSQIGLDHPCIICVFENKEIEIPMPDFKTAQAELKEFATVLCRPEIKFQQPFQPF
jgi:Fe2+ or Zn2+ uptake regulation protein